MSVEIIVSLIASTLAMGTGILFATAGEIVTERSGVLNLGVEGMLVFSAMTAYTIFQTTQNVWLALLAAVIAGGLMAALHAFVCVTLKVNQVVSGIALSTLGVGLAVLLGSGFTAGGKDMAIPAMHVPGLSDIPVVGPIFTQSPLVYVAIAMVIVLAIVLKRTRLGINIRAVGENPAAADAAGLPVFGIRYGATIFGGCMAGLGGAYLTLSYYGGWNEGIVNTGQGWIAVALVIFASWKPYRAMGGAYLFGMLMILNYTLQAIDVNISPALFSLVPYAATIVVLLLTTGQFKGAKRFGAPAGLGIAYDREAR